MVLFVPSDADDDDDGVPTTLPALPWPKVYHAQGSNVPFGESLTLMKDPGPADKSEAFPERDI